MKDAGNASVKEEKWKHAISSYNAAINIDASNHLLFRYRALHSPGDMEDHIFPNGKTAEES